MKKKKKMSRAVMRLEIQKFKVFRTSHTVVSYFVNFDTLAKVFNAELVSCFGHRGSKDILNCSFF